MSSEENEEVKIKSVENKEVIMNSLCTFHTQHFPLCTFSTLCIFDTLLFPHSAFSTPLTPHIPPNLPNGNVQCKYCRGITRADTGFKRSAQDTDCQWWSPVGGHPPLENVFN